ncbi:Uncharacterised protein [Legionella wadsworthii]|uniref:Uncharacterized protein n=1 Tax=Legionella wadsworthii TaxID=28088 RepID=A0A378M2G4_9GAMM|nr:OmpH family outer membrane protein [Legionella wadsworthii]STY31256.1 Uncharacterised protein [Legionella wadsworthii]
MLSRVEVIADSGGAISETGSNVEQFTKGFGGCTAIYAKIDQTKPGFYGLYHLRSVFATKSHMVEGYSDSNEPFRNWIGDLGKRAQGQKIHFEIGRPLIHGNKNKIMDSHPDLGMELYLRTICAQHEIENYEITLLNMIGVKSIAVNEKGMVCYGYKNMETKVSPAQYQSDEEILEHSGWPNKKCLGFAKSHRHVDLHGKLQKKYEQKCEMEQKEKKIQEMDAKQNEIETRRNELEKQQIEKLKAAKESLLKTINDMVCAFRTSFEEGPKEDRDAFNQFFLLEDLFHAVKTDDLGSILEMKNRPYFKKATENDLFMSFFSQDLNEIGLIFNEAEKLLIHLHKSLSEKMNDNSQNMSM